MKCWQMFLLTKVRLFWILAVAVVLFSLLPGPMILDDFMEQTLILWR